MFHNHLTFDAVNEAVPYESSGFWKLIHEFREKIVSLAAKQKRPGLIYTGCYNFGGDDKTMARMIRAAERHGAKTHLVHLIADPEVIAKRVTLPSRKGHRKLTNSKEFRKSLRKYEFFKQYPKRPSLVIDNTKKSAGAVAKEIKTHYRL